MSTQSLVKEPYKPTVFNSEKELDDFVKCCDPVNGYLYFMDNFFMIQHPTQGSIQLSSIRISKTTNRHISQLSL